MGNFTDPPPTLYYSSENDVGCFPCLEDLPLMHMMDINLKTRAKQITNVYKMLIREN